MTSVQKADQKVDPALRKQLITKGYIDHFWENLIKVGKEKITQSYLKARLSLLEDYWRRFENDHYALLELDDTATADYMSKDLYTVTEDNYIAAKTKITSLLNEDGAPSRLDSSFSFMTQIQLPKMSLPTFSGEQLTWESFRDLFRSLVHEVPDLAPVQKLQYLKASLTGEAAAVVANMELTDRGYEMAWSELSSRYDNKRVLLSTHMRAFLSSPPMAKASSADLKQLISVALQAKRSFESLGRPVAHWDDWFVHVIVEKLDSQSRLFWEASLRTSSEFPTFHQLQDFLQTRIRALDAANPKGSAIALAASSTKQDRKAQVSVPRPGLPTTKGIKKESPNAVKTPAQKELPPNLKNIHPVTLLNNIRPGLTYAELSRVGNTPSNTMFTLAVKIGGVEYSGTAKNKKDAKKAAAKAALLALYNMTKG